MRLYASSLFTKNLSATLAVLDMDNYLYNVNCNKNRNDNTNEIKTAVIEHSSFNLKNVKRTIDLNLKTNSDACCA